MRHGPGPNAASSEGETALIVSAQNGHEECIRPLLDAGANVNAADCAPPRPSRAGARRPAGALRGRPPLARGHLGSGLLVGALCRRLAALLLDGRRLVRPLNLNVTQEANHFELEAL